MVKPEFDAVAVEDAAGAVLVSVGAAGVVFADVAGEVVGGGAVSETESAPLLGNGAAGASSVAADVAVFIGEAGVFVTLFVTVLVTLFVAPPGVENAEVVAFATESDTAGCEDVFADAVVAGAVVADVVVDAGEPATAEAPSAEGADAELPDSALATASFTACAIALI